MPRFEALGYVLPHFDDLTHVAIRGSSAFISPAFCGVVIIFHRSSLKRAERLLKGCLLKLLSFKTAQYNFILC